ncbi:lytic polysaccharide monooxygenase [Patellaria atrata CBS 101060]|uniref:AA9 family lytic polysaccharide monooxygenase n=1 Tax=Patellaria atrata CBS 101060 TaxID=1346257 RepID=A0A9P4SGH9_9PEZI|nr:lytic polysaccharide monooxygenase [Patellaria atrata CBS 101060]
MKVLFPTYLLIASVSAHTIFQKLWVNGVDQGQLKGIRAPEYDGPITDVTSNDVICNGGPNPIKYTDSNIINIPAGANVIAEWHKTLTSAGSGDKEDPIADGHKGPTMIYLAKVDNALTKTVTGLKWFKIFADGFDPATNTWGVDRMYAAKGKVSFTMPSCIVPGNYLLRAEVIALHAAASYPGAQLYMGCAQVNVVGAGGTTPSGVSFPGAYKGSDPGIKFQLFWPTPTAYTIPGPTVFKC